MDDFTHHGVLQGRIKLTCGTPFLIVQNLSDFGFYCGFVIRICERNLTDIVLHLLGIIFHFTFSYMAVLRAWIFVYPTLFSSALLLALHRRHRRYKPYANTLTQTELETLCRLYGKSEGKEKKILFRIIHKYGADKLKI